MLQPEATGGRGLAMPRSLAGANPAQVTVRHGPGIEPCRHDGDVGCIPERLHFPQTLQVRLSARVLFRTLYVTGLSILAVIIVSSFEAVSVMNTSTQDLLNGGVK